ncbi:hypothetical protein B0H14DRAFT_2588027 [Mycena olivaceomarginata]|nr:hypothetical protein B0H14DRAFT_2588027 [Mycena olivaceomarginata]
MFSCPPPSRNLFRSFAWVLATFSDFLFRISHDVTLSAASTTPYFSTTVGSCASGTSAWLLFVLDLLLVNSAIQYEVISSSIRAGLAAILHWRSTSDNSCPVMLEDRIQSANGLSDLYITPNVSTEHSKRKNKPSSSNWPTSLPQTGSLGLNISAIKPLASPRYAAFSTHVLPTFPRWVISPIAVTNDDLWYTPIFLQSENSLILIWSKVDLRTSPTPSTGSARARRNTSANEDHRPSFEACSSRLLFCERVHDAINLSPSLLSIPIEISLQVRKLHTAVREYHNYLIKLLQACWP